MPWRLRVAPGLAAALPTALLLTVAGTQLVLSKTMRLSPWKGGGFGMFASVDGLPFRAVRIQVEGPDRSEVLLVPVSLEDQARRTATFPHDAALERMARAVGERERRRGTPVSVVTVEVWRATYSSTLEATWGQLAARTLAADGTARDAR
jgi:hypothetical protein